MQQVSYRSISPKYVNTGALMDCEYSTSDTVSTNGMSWGWGFLFSNQ